MLRVWSVWVSGQDPGTDAGLVVYARSDDRARMLAEASTGRVAVHSLEIAAPIDGPHWVMSDRGREC